MVKLCPSVEKGQRGICVCPQLSKGVVCTVTVQEEEEPDEEPLLLLAHNGAVILGPVCYVRAIPYCYLLGQVLLAPRSSTSVPEIQSVPVYRNNILLAYCCRSLQIDHSIIEIAVYASWLARDSDSAMLHGSVCTVHLLVIVYVGFTCQGMYT